MFRSDVPRGLKILIGTYLAVAAYSRGGCFTIVDIELNRCTLVVCDFQLVECRCLRKNLSRDLLQNISEFL